jgi:hypothetical protein
VRGWVRLSERVRRRFFGEWIARPTRDFNGDYYSDVGTLAHSAPFSLTVN